MLIKGMGAFDITHESTVYVLYCVRIRKHTRVKFAN